VTAPVAAQKASHKCPAAGCPQAVSLSMLMCRPHWYMVPAPLRAAVWNAWADGLGAGTPAHWAAITAAITAVNRKLAERGKS
jgi:hypothetical protein